VLVRKVDEGVRWIEWKHWNVLSKAMMSGSVEEGGQPQPDP
jgi:hypothetical protein